MEKRTRLDDKGLLFLAGRLKNAIDEAAVVIDSALSSESTNDCAAGSKAVFELVNAAASECVKNEDLSAVTDGIINEVMERTFEPNLLINPDFRINQRSITGTFSETGKYFVDRWKLVSGTVTINSDGTLTLNGSICQPLENAAGTNVTASVSAGTAVYDDTAKIFTVTGNGEVISWAKLEIGSAATPFIPPEPVSEMLKCQRYYLSLGSHGRYVRYTRTRYNSTDIDFIIPVNTMFRIIPDIIGDPMVYKPVDLAQTGFTFTIPGISQNAIAIRASKTSHGSTDVYLDVRNGVAFDAEIY